MNKRHPCLDYLILFILYSKYKKAHLRKLLQLHFRQFTFPANSCPWSTTIRNCHSEFSAGFILRVRTRVRISIDMCNVLLSQRKANLTFCVYCCGEQGAVCHLRVSVIKPRTPCSQYPRCCRSPGSAATEMGARRFSPSGSSACTCGRCKCLNSTGNRSNLPNKTTVSRSLHARKWWCIVWDLQGAPATARCSWGALAIPLRGERTPRYQNSTNTG